jgi:hypothetical protein
VLEYEMKRRVVVLVISVAVVWGIRTPRMAVDVVVEFPLAD